MSRNIIFHCHFFKNAGSSVDWALRRSFGKEFYENKKVFPIAEWNDYLALLVKNESFHVLSSHIFSLRPPIVENTNFHIIALYRHPIERVTSVAAYEKRQNYRNSLGTITNVDIDMCGYVKAYLEPGTPASIRNMHTLRFAGRDNGMPVTDEDFAKAVDTLDNCPTIGLVEAFDESMVLFEEHLRPIFPSLNLAYIPQNVMQVAEPLEKRIQNLKTEIGNETFEMLCKKNEFDLRLYELAKVRFKERLASIPDFHKKLHSFRARCSELKK